MGRGRPPVRRRCSVHASGWLHRSPSKGVGGRSFLSPHAACRASAKAPAAECARDRPRSCQGTRAFQTIQLGNQCLISRTACRWKCQRLSLFGGSVPRQRSGPPDLRRPLRCSGLFHTCRAPRSFSIPALCRVGCRPAGHVQPAAVKTTLTYIYALRMCGRVIQSSLSGTQSSTGATDACRTISGGGSARRAKNCWSSARTTKQASVRSIFCGGA